jgi:DNA-directed RNA polymerase specialized sigma24 family protein
LRIAAAGDGVYPCFTTLQDGRNLLEPGLPGALAALSRRQRLVVVLVHGFGYTLHEVAELTGMRRTTVQNHSDRWKLT